MARYFLDSSALVKRYVGDEIGHDWVATLCDPNAGHVLIIAEVTLAEVVTTFARMARQPPVRCTITERDQFIALFRQDVQNSYLVLPLSHEICDRAGDLACTHPLRAYDAIQLSCALSVRDEAITLGLDVPTFVCADANLLTIAGNEGLAVENPNQHP